MSKYPIALTGSFRLYKNEWMANAIETNVVNKIIKFTSYARALHPVIFLDTQILHIFYNVRDLECITCSRLSTLLVTVLIRWPKKNLI